MAETDTPSVVKETTRDMSAQFREWFSSLVRIYKSDIGNYTRSKGTGEPINRTLSDGVNIRFYKKNDTMIYNIYQIHEFSECSFLCLMLFKIDYKNTIPTHVHIELTYLTEVESDYRPIDDSSQDWIKSRIAHIKNNSINKTAGIFYGPDKTNLLLGGPNIYVNIKQLLLCAVNIPLKIFFKNLITTSSKVSKYMYALYVTKYIYTQKEDFAKPLQKLFNKKSIKKAIDQYHSNPTAKFTINDGVIYIFTNVALVYDYIFTYALIFPYDHNGSEYTKIQWFMDIVNDMSSSENSRCAMFNDIALDYLKRYSGPYGTYPRKNPPVNEPLDDMYAKSMSTMSPTSSVYLKSLPIFGSVQLKVEFINTYIL